MATARQCKLRGVVSLPGQRSCWPASIWFYLATFVIVPANAAEVYNTVESTYFQRYGALGDSAADIFISLFTRPQLVWQIAV